ncbi:DUF1697 domain-containing protein [Bacillus sp. 1P06AnD]|uniref:DUF1697 domain-containing protein n=1 Tax=Bacillus sp. 1P06AnD TaxID=3132208 RepID=UPI00399F9B81
MSVYIAFLRGINVGGKNKIKMAELRILLEGMGLKTVQTYIQSGNVLFEADEDPQQVERGIARQIEGRFGFRIDVVVRNALELERIIHTCPFSEQAIEEADKTCEGEPLHVAFLKEDPLQEGIDMLATLASCEEEYVIDGREVYLLFPRSIRYSKLAGQLNKLGVPATARNWKTINKLAAMAKALDQ